ncbi:uncharacterized protein LOC111279963 isoform X2 [Durio zibethinus]|uniref:Uncharacterized protein LOC111279963 isoform X2 n=1 Tax=Durio zibethinus TaxID=66656 RepID=A0A6P5X339_DURZI|nr:uncharacterized protein LOC111279963 isoform X2 [Durio zibethinus]
MRRNPKLTKILKDFLLWVEKDLGPWGPLVLAVAYIPLTVLAVPASVLTLGGGYLFGLPVGFIADSIGATVGAGAAFLLGRTIGRSFVVSKLKDYPQFRSVAIAIRRSGFKIVLLLRLVPLLPFNMLNYLLSVTPVPIGEYMLASWLGMMPITLALVYVGTTLKDLSDVTHGWSEFSTARWAFLILGLAVSGLLYTKKMSSPLVGHKVIITAGDIRAKVSKSQVTKSLESFKRKMPGLGIFHFGGCFDGCRDHTQASGLGTRVWNLSDRPVELQVRVGSILKKVHTLKPRSSKRLKCKSIYKAYMPGRSGNSSGGMKSLLYYYDETCHPYIWVHNTGGDSSRMVKQQYISLDDLRDCSEIRIFIDHQRGCISVRKKPRPDFC